MRIEKNNFDRCIQSCNEMNAVYSYLKSKSVTSIEIDSILRAEFVLSVSAFDYYIHQIVCRKLTDSFFSKSPVCDATLITMSDIQLIHKATSTLDQQQILYSAIKTRLSKDSFQSSRNVDYALGLIGVPKVWSKLSKTMGDTPERIKKQLDVIVHRRNQIAHEADIDYSTNDYRSISESDVEDCKKFLSILVTNIDKLL